MSLGDHLEELRARLILAILGLLLGTVVSLAFGTRILTFIEDPYVRTMSKRLAEKERPRVKSEMADFAELFFTNLTRHLVADPNAPNIDPNLIAFVKNVSMETVDAWVDKTQGPGSRGLPYDAQLTVLAPADAFVAYLKVSLIAGLILSSPWVFYQIWMFVAAGLYENERKYIHTAIPFSTALFIIGALFFLFIIARLTLGFFLSFGDVVGVTANWTLQKYISFVTTLMLVFGIAFQTPIAVLILVRAHLVSIRTLRRSRKYVILGLAFLAAVATPPDVVSMVSLLVPLYGLYELGIILAGFADKKAREGQASASATGDSGRSVKKRSISIFLAAILGIGVVWVVLTFLYAGPPSMPSYAFLAGRNHVERERIDTRTWPSARVWRDTYSFAGDFNNVCARARTELWGLGFVDLGLRGEAPRTREYERRTASGDPLVTVRICEDSEFVRDAKAPQASRQAKPGSVTVDVIVTDRSLRLWKDLKGNPVGLLRRVGLLKNHRGPTTLPGK
ncbi:MAG: twin-arginine translocase subunit TatC [Sedimentisphaerales bacterium]|nr:twin-arginine translocase subunit TatC [Sedimentisphaerales bacterium]